MNHFGTDIMFAGAMNGTGRCKSYRFVASTREDMPDIAIIRVHPIWSTKNEKRLMWKVRQVLNHEPIHQILWWLGVDPQTTYDIVKLHFIKMLCKTKEQRDELRAIL